jgi:8-oxo-dGTP pyrophosphatase MutT (NUDIX family)
VKTYLIASAVILNDAGDLLILKRSNDDPLRPGEPDLAGGEANDGEGPFDAAIREILEETGLRYTNQDLRLVFGWTIVKYHTEEKTEVNFVHTGFVAVLPKDQQIQLSHEHQSYAWQSLDEAIPGFVDRPSKKNFLKHLHDHEIEPRLTHGKVI